MPAARDHHLIVLFQQEGPPAIAADTRDLMRESAHSPDAMAQ
jgi:hypothetical protein